MEKLKKKKMNKKEIIYLSSCSGCATGSSHRSGAPATPLAAIVNGVDSITTAQTAHAVADDRRQRIGSGIADVIEEAIGHQLPVARLPLASQILRFGRQIGRQDGHLRLFHVGQDRLAQGRRQRRQEIGRIDRFVGVDRGGRALLLQSLLRQHFFLDVGGQSG